MSRKKRDAERPVLDTIYSDKFCVELRPVEDGPMLCLAGFGHDAEMTLTVVGIEGTEDAPQETASIFVTLDHLESFIQEVKKAKKRAI